MMMSKTTKIFQSLALVMTLTVSLSMAQGSDELAEKIVIPLSDPGAIGTLEVNQIYGGMKVTGYNGKEVVVVAKQKKMKSTVKMKNGLRKIQNNSMALEAEESDNHVEVVAMNHNGGNSKYMNLEIQVPKNFNLKLQSINDGDIWIENINGEIEVSNVNDDITLNRVSGSAVVDSVNGLIKANFSAITPGSKLVFTSFNEDVDITLPQSVKADFKLKTTYGDIFTGFDIDFDASEPVIKKDSREKSYKVKLEKWVSGTANGGGTEIVLKIPFWRPDSQVQVSLNKAKKLLVAYQ